MWRDLNHLNTVFLNPQPFGLWTWFFTIEMNPFRTSYQRKCQYQLYLHLTQAHEWASSPFQTTQMVECDSTKVRGRLSRCSSALVFSNSRAILPPESGIGFRSLPVCYLITLRHVHSLTVSVRYIFNHLPLDILPTWSVKSKAVSGKSYTSEGKHLMIWVELRYFAWNRTLLSYLPSNWSSRGWKDSKTM